jgi:hypothetical protein
MKNGMTTSLALIDMYVAVVCMCVDEEKEEEEGERSLESFLFFMI